MTRPRLPLHVVLVNYRTRDDIRRLLAGGVLAAADEVTVVDNASDPEVVQEWAHQYGIRPIAMPVNVGFAKAVNRAIRDLPRQDACTLLLNPDVHIESDQIESLRADLEDIDADAVAPVLVGIDGRTQVGAAGGPVTLRSVAAYFLFVSHLLPGVRGIFHTRRQLRRGGRADWLCMACLLSRPGAFATYGPVPEDELVYAEDIAWGTRAAGAGARFVLRPDIVLVHEQGASGGASVWAAALKRLMLRRMPGWRGRAAVGTMRVGLSIRRAMGRKVDR